MNYINLSLVIASHKGSKKLINLLNSIILGKSIPKEIIIVCSTDEYNKYIFNLKKFNKIFNIIILKSKIKNQIYQRQIGLAKARNDYILQLDDDLTLDKNTIKLLYENVNKSHFKKIFCLNLIDKNKNPLDSRWSYYYRHYTSFKVALYFLNGYKKIQPNTIIKSGRPIPSFKKNYRYEWLNSSLCFHKNAMKDYKFFDTVGKAYYEDIFTSHSFLVQGYELKKITNSILIHPKTNQIDFNEHLKAFQNQKIIVKTFKKNIILLYFDFLIFSLFFIQKKIKNKFIL